MAIVTVSTVQPNSAANFSTTISSCNTWDLKSVAIIALPIIAALASFVFLPVEIAIVLTAVVTIGAIAYHQRQKAPTVTPTQPPKIQAPLKISHRFWVENKELGIKNRSALSMVLQSLEATEEFCKQYGAQFTDCKIVKSDNPKWPEIKIIPLVEGKSDEVLKRLLKIFPVGVDE